MRVLVPEIAAHANIEQNKNQEILSVDFHPTLPVFASAGAGENQIIFWRLRAQASEVSTASSSSSTDTTTTTSNGMDWLEFLFEMTEGKTVNVVRFSPASGDLLACGDAAGQVSVLSLKNNTYNWGDVRDAKEVRKQSLRGGHTLDVLDVAFSPSADDTSSPQWLVSAGMDNLVVVWDLAAGSELHRFREHTHYCQGVALNSRFIASCSADESALVYAWPASAGGAPQKLGSGGKRTITGKLFANEVQAGGAFCRRLAFSPHGGELLLVPGGLVDGQQPAVHVFRFLLQRRDADADADAVLSPLRLEALSPCATLTGFTKTALAVRFHPCEFDPVQVEGEEETGMASTARFVFAIATLDAVLVYDTQRPCALALCDKLHYASLTDLAWHYNDSTGQSFLVASSRDGCFSVLRFEEGELGTVRRSRRPQRPREDVVVAIVSLEVDESSSASVASSTNPGGAASPSKRRVKLECIQPVAAAAVAVPAVPTVAVVPNTLQPRRVKLIKLVEKEEEEEGK